MKLSKNILAIALLLGYAATSFATQCPTSNVINDPELFQWTYHPVSANNPEAYYSGTLEVGEATFTIGGETLTTRAYRQAGSAYSIPGPTLQMVPGNKYVVSFKNNLPYEAASLEHNVFKDPNITNIHTHGLHLSGEGVGDDVTRMFEGGTGGDYVYDIPADHMGGSYWYHAHHHGSTYLQVAGGALGTIIIDDSLDGLPANVAAMQEKQLTVAYLDPTAAGTGGDVLMSGTMPAQWTVNGTVNGNICTPPNTWQHWRVLLADRDARSKTVSVGSQCEVALMARDGVWRTQAPKNLATNSITITGASRADLAVRCSADSSLMVNGNAVANIFTDGVTDTAAYPFAADGVSMWSANRPSYLRDLRGVSQVNNETVRMGARTINGSKFDMNTPTFTLPAEQVQHWSINGATNHPFHLHIYHFQIQGACGDYEDGEYYDTIAGSCDVRFDLNAQTSSVYSGKTIMHCHILDHEDQGAMGWIKVVGGIAGPSYPNNADLAQPYSAYYQLGGGNNGSAPNAPTSLAASVLSSSQINLSWLDNSTDENSFDLERSLDGANFSTLASLPADTTNHADIGLQASTSYFYRVRAVNANGNSAYSNVVNATTSTDTQATALQVGSITVSTVGIAKGLKMGRAVVVVHDDQGGTVANATVSGEFSGSINEVIDASTPTDASGSTTIDSTGTAKGGVQLTFCVTRITHNTLQEFTSAPGVMCGVL